MPKLPLRPMPDGEFVTYRDRRIREYAHEHVQAGHWTAEEAAAKAGAAHRGGGYGRALLAAAEEELRHRGAPAVGLNVVGHNEVALRLYASSGYRVTSPQMLKELG